MTNTLETDARGGIGRYWTDSAGEACQLIEALYALYGSRLLARVESSTRLHGSWWVLVHGMSEVRLVALAGLRREWEPVDITAAMLDQAEADILRQQAVAFDSWLDGAYDPERGELG